MRKMEWDDLVGKMVRVTARALLDDVPDRIVVGFLLYVSDAIVKVACVKKPDFAETEKIWTEYVKNIEELVPVSERATGAEDAAWDAKRWARMWLTEHGVEPDPFDWRERVRRAGVRREPDWFACDHFVHLPLNEDDRITRFDTSDGALKVWTRDWRCFVVHDDHTYSELA